MKTVLIGWELGGGLGHVTRAASYAKALTHSGFRVVVALSDLADIGLVQWPEDVLLLPAPQPRRRPPNFFNQATYAELLYGCGYHDVHQISGLLMGWFNLIDVAQADLLLADHAPAAHLAARVMGVPHARIGSGFFAPPLAPKTPNFRTWQAIDQPRAWTVERRVIDAINLALEAAGAKPASSVAEALLPDLDLIASPPELDNYAALRPPGSVVYLGVEKVDDLGQPPIWPEPPSAGSKRVVAYLKADYGPLQAVVSGLAQGHSSAVFVSGLGEQQSHALQADHVWLTREPMQINAALRDCDLLVCHGGASTPATCLAAGKPVLLLPYSAEQQVNALQIAATGSGRVLSESEVHDGFLGQLQALLASEEVLMAARRLESRWAGQADGLGYAVSRLKALID